MNETINSIYKYLLQALADGVYAPGTLIPYERELAQRFGTNRMNAKRAVERLAGHGLVVRRRRKGTEVAGRLDSVLVHDLLAANDNIVVVLHSAHPSNIHWNNDTFLELDKIVRQHRGRLIYKTIPVESGYPAFAGLMDELAKLCPLALTVFIDNFEFDFLQRHGSLFKLFSCPVIFLNRSGQIPCLDNITSIDIDHFRDGVSIGELLVLNDCRHTAFFCPLPLKNTVWGRQRLRGIVREFLDHGFPEPVLFTEVSGELTGFIRKYAPRAMIVAINNEIAARIIDHLLTGHKLLAGRDYNLVAFDDCEFYSSSKLTSLVVPAAEIGALMGKMICEKQWPREFLPRLSLKVHSSLIVRDTFRPG